MHLMPIFIENKASGAMDTWGLLRGNAGAQRAATLQNEQRCETS